MAPTKRDRILGALLGVHAGDSLGATLEFRDWQQIQKSHPQGLRDIIGGGLFSWSPGHATDDTDLTRAVLLAYRDQFRATKDLGASNGPFDLGRVAGNYMLDWMDGRWPDRKEGSLPVDAGGATVQGLGLYRLTRDPRKAGAGPGSAGNGSLMRCIPTACFAQEEKAIIDDSVLISAITHNDERCTVACAAYNILTRALIQGSSVEEALSAAKTVAAQLEGGDGPVSQALQKGCALSLREMAENGPVQLEGGASGYVIESLIIAIAAVRDERSLEDVVVDAVRIGRDTDSNAAIAGGLLGARDGIGGIPERWRRVLQFGDEFTRIVDEIGV